VSSSLYKHDDNADGAKFQGPLSENLRNLRTQVLWDPIPSSTNLKSEFVQKTNAACFRKKLIVLLIYIVPMNVCICMYFNIITSTKLV
jgi:hypothetical protein